MVKKPKLKITQQTFLSRAGERHEEAEEADCSYEVEEKNSNFETQSQSSKRKLSISGSNQDIFLDTGNDENLINGSVRRPQASNSIINELSSSSSNFLQRPITNELQSFILDKTQQSETRSIQPIRSSSESSTYSIFSTGSSKKPATGSIIRTLSATGSTHRTLLPNSRSNSRSRSVSIPKISNIKHKPQNHNQKECLDGFNELRSQLASFKSRFF
jgi:hypothetical protein